MSLSLFCVGQRLFVGEEKKNVCCFDVSKSLCENHRKNRVTKESSLALLRFDVMKVDDKKDDASRQ